MKYLLLLSVALLAVSASLTMVSAAEDESKVVVLDTSNFDDFVKDTDLALIEFYAPWCGHCKALAPEYDEAAEKIDGKNAGKLAKVDCTTQREICDRFEVRGFPTVKLFRNDEGWTPVDYDGARKADAIAKYMIKQNAPAVTVLASEDEIAGFAADERVKIVGFFASEADGADFVKVAKLLRNDYEFASITGEGQTNGVKLYRNFAKDNEAEEDVVAFEGELSGEQFGEELTKFIKAWSFPLVGEIGPENYSQYLDRGFPFVWVFIDKDNEEQTKMIADAVEPVAKDYRTELSFVKLDGVKWSEHAKSFGLSGNTPGIVIESRATRKNYIFDEETEVSKEALKNFAAGFLDGSLTPNLKSEPIPESNDGPVTVLVGKNFEEIVFDDEKDVLVEFYAPWCGHCKSLAPKYEKLGEEFKDNANVVIAKVDATANDTPEEIRGFPTLIFYPAGDKKNTVPYEGARTVEAMAKFVRENGKAAAAAPADGDDAAAAGNHEEL
eukprot:TRINITY_DN65703_c3_g4_i1.p1 TRINITY_DN65703_c3_g4~~TRINITY_DN65703_c3_g4_i1.p1  ORF type:complete len:497 (-),score=340.27 TRINITY_DN65703_c3_g4_i1:196-1686(-)